MSIQLYNSLTKRKENFEPMEPGKVKMYVCGPTVYNFIHIGNARPPIVFDVVRNYLTYRGYEVTYIQNFTDVDDKLIRKAEETGQTVLEVAEQFIAAYKDDVTALGVKEAKVHPRVSDHIEEIVDFVKQLIDKGFAYESSGDVYFRTDKFDEYGKLSHQNIEELQSGARIAVNEQKENPLDFVLWKSAKPGEISWPSPWGEGRPGWHIECSAMSMKYLGESFDIHGGGHDLIFPHHENEIAQTEALTGKSMAKYWMHNGYINIDNEKMSKSLGNFILVKELREQVPPHILRFFMLSAHYRNPINFSQELLEQAQNAWDRIITAVTNLEHRKQAATADTHQEQEKQDQYRLKFQEAMDNDFNTADALAIVFEWVRESNQYLRNNKVSMDGIQVYLNLLKEFGDVLGLPFIAEGAELLDEEIDSLIHERVQARKDRNFKRADEIRDLLQEQGIILEDTPQGVRWRRK
ncbi:cysteine--tRNA ligase [Ammoniphilus sp. CFH 90114]|uniref:cysteine--tRNA ligase n=1 Tax=Ammoniphilus sp. CFH 90114 TaxID=2493665 RepID=UPI00100FBBC4|nr:cysteine--tRNA ligase [Ammoniphilus sp. CFH 90114]RXT09054.1 cysteine--tRNA ligase [Ammoniphilus sp. CFH 90114]